MKLDCGPSSGARYATYIEARRAKLTVWHRWFAWYPVRISESECRWLEYVERRYEKVYSYNGEPFNPEYRAL